MLIALAGWVIGGTGLFVGISGIFLLLFVGVPFVMAYVFVLATLDLETMADWRGFGIWKRTVNILFGDGGSE